MNKARLLEALLFTKPGTLSWRELGGYLDMKPADVRPVAEAVRATYEERAGGLSVLLGEDGVTLATAPDLADALAQLEIRERTAPLSKAQMETLALVLYHGSPSKSEVDEIRSVNSVHALRALTSRGLVAKMGDGRAVRYVVTPEALAHLGVAHAADAPEFSVLHEKVLETVTPAETPAV